MKKWLELLVEEKGLDREDVLEVNGRSGINHIPLGCLMDAILTAPEHEQVGIKNTLVKLDFLGKNIVGYFQHLAQAIAI